MTIFGPIISLGLDSAFPNHVSSVASCFVFFLLGFLSRVFIIVIVNLLNLNIYDHIVKISVVFVIILKSQESPRSPEKPVKRPFLRRGQGLERFKGPPQKKKTPAPAKSSSTTNKKNEVPIKKTVTATKASVGQGSKGLKKNNNKPASAKANTTKPDWCEGVSDALSSAAKG